MLPKPPRNCRRSRGVGLGVGSEAADNEAGQAVESRFGKGRRLRRGGRWDEVFIGIEFFGRFRGFVSQEMFERLEDLDVFLGGRVIGRIGGPMGYLPGKQLPAALFDGGE